MKGGACGKWKIAQTTATKPDWPHRAGGKHLYGANGISALVKSRLETGTRKKETRQEKGG